MEMEIYPLNNQVRTQRSSAENASMTTNPVYSRHIFRALLLLPKVWHFYKVP